MKRPFFHLGVALACSLLGLSMMAGPIQATSITLGKLEITRVKPGVPNWTWTSPSMVNTNKVPQNDPLQATVDISYSFSAQQQALINDDSGYTYSQKLWFDADRTFLGFGDKDLAKTVTKYTFHAGGPTTLVYAPPGFTITQFGALSDGDSRADFEIEASNGRTFSLDPETKEVWLQNGAIAGGAAGGPRAGTQGISYDPPSDLDHVDAIQAPAPPLPPSGIDRVYEFSSTDGSTIQIKGFNDTGFSFALASGNLLDVPYPQEPNADPPLGHKTTFDPSVSFTTLLENGATTIGTLSQPGSVWAILGGVDQPPLDFTGFSYTAMPSMLPGDGGISTVSASSLGVGRAALWTTFDLDNGQTIGFLIVGVPEPPTILMFGTALVCFGLVRGRRRFLADLGWIGYVERRGHRAEGC